MGHLQDKSLEENPFSFHYRRKDQKNYLPKLTTLDKKTLETNLQGNVSPIFDDLSFSGQLFSSVV